MERKIGEMICVGRWGLNRRCDREVGKRGGRGKPINSLSPYSLLSILILFVLLLGGCSSYRAPREASPPSQTAAADHYRQHGDASSLRSVAADIKPGMHRDTIVRLLGPPAYSPSDNQDYYPTELRNESGLTLVLVVNYHAEGTAQAGTIEWYTLDYIGE